MLRDETVEEMQTALDHYLVTYNQRRPHQGRGMNGLTSAQAFTDGLPNLLNKGVRTRSNTTATQQAT